MALVSDIMAANRDDATQHGTTSLPARPARQMAILTCMDARIEPFRTLGLRAGDAHVIRNAGGRASDDALRSLIVSTTILGTRTIIVIHHTECGMIQPDNTVIRQQVAETVGTDPGDIDFLPITDLNQSIRDDMATIRDHPLLPDDITVIGFLLDIQTGLLEPVT